MRTWLACVSRAFAVLLLIGAMLAPAAESSAQQANTARGQSTDSSLAELHEDNLLVLEVRLDRRGSGHGLIAYQHGEAALLPLGEICSILELAIMVDTDQGTAEGWIVDESRTFELNLAALTVAQSGNLTPLPKDAVARDETDIYVLSTLLEQWLPADLAVSLPRMHVDIKPRETLPFQSRLKRDEQRSLWLASQNRATLKYPMQLAPYRLWSWPLVDATVSMYTGRVESRRLALESYADLAGMSTNLFVSSVGNEYSSQTVARLKAGRWDPEGSLLGPLAATEYELGDIFINRVPLISTSKQGLGLALTNQSLNRSREFNTTVIQGDVPPGWEAELYINGSLYDFQTIGESGKYLFVDVPLIVGSNIFRTVLYGPRGEVREVVQNENISPEMSDIGELKYRVTVLQEGKGLLTTPPARNGVLYKAWNQQLELSYALSHRHALVANFSRLSVEGQKELFSSLTSHNSIGPLYTEAILAKSLKGGGALQLSVRTNVQGQNLFTQFMTNNNYRAEAFYGRSYLTREGIIRSSGNLAHLGRYPLYYNLSATTRAFADSYRQQEDEVKLNLSAGLGRFILSHALRYRDTTFADNDEQTTLGTQLIRTQLGSLSLRADLNYELSPSRVRSAGATIGWYQTDKVQFMTRASHFLKPEFGNDNLAADLTVFFDHFSLGMNYSYFKSGGSSVGITLGTFLTRDIRSNAWAIQHRRMASRSMASVRAFIDLNANKVFDEGDEPLVGVGFKNLSAWRKVRTNDDGIALLAGILVHRPQTIELDLTTVDDPFLVPLSKGVNVIGHPGSFVNVEFPFSYVGEMEGVIRESDRPDRPVRHVGLEILDSDGNRVNSTVGEFDGYYYFSELLPGEYTLNVIPSTINTNRYTVPEPMTIIIPGEGGYIDGPDIVLERRPELDPVPPVVAALSADDPATDEATPSVVEASDTPSVGETSTAPVVVAAAEPDTVPIEQPDVAAAESDTISIEQSEVAAAEPDTVAVEEPEVAAAEPDTVAVEELEVAAAEPDTIPVEQPEVAAAQPDTIEVEQPEIAAALPETTPEPETEPTVAAADDEATGLPAVAVAGAVDGPAGLVESAHADAGDDVVDLEELTAVPDFDQDQTLSLIFEMLHRNSLWPGEPIQ